MYQTYFYCSRYWIVCFWFSGHKKKMHVKATSICCISVIKHRRDLEMKLTRGKGGNPLTSLTLPHYCVCPKQGHGFMSWEVIGHFVDIGGIVDHYCLNFLFMIYLIMFWPPNLYHDGKHFDTNNLPWPTQSLSKCNLQSKDFNQTATIWLWIKLHLIYS